MPSVVTESIAKIDRPWPTEFVNVIKPLNEETEYVKVGASSRVQTLEYKLSGTSSQVQALFIWVFS